MANVLLLNIVQLFTQNPNMKPQKCAHPAVNMSVFYEKLTLISGAGMEPFVISGKRRSWYEDANQNPCCTLYIFTHHYTTITRTLHRYEYAITNNEGDIEDNTDSMTDNYDALDARLSSVESSVDSLEDEDDDLPDWIKNPAVGGTEF